MRTVYLIAVSVLTALAVVANVARTWASVGSHGTFPATSAARAVSFDVGSSASGVSTAMSPIPRDTILQLDATAAVGYRSMWDALLLRDTLLHWDTVADG